MIPEKPAAKGIPAKILVLDDETTIAELLCEMLDMLGHQTVFTLSGHQALEMLDKTEFDLILSDFRMPQMNGREFHKQVSAKNPALARRIIFLTGDIVNDETQDFLKSTGNPHLGKPFQLANLQSVVSQVLAAKAVSAT